MRTMPELETERLVLRPVEPGDLDAFAQIYADPDVMRYLGGSVRTRDQVRASIAAFRRHWELYDIGHFALVRKADGRTLGRAGFLVWDPDTWTHGMIEELAPPYETELGWTLGREHWGHGYATEGAAAARDWGYAERSFPRLISLIARDNAASIRVAERLGAKPGRVIDEPPFTSPTCVYEHVR